MSRLGLIPPLRAANSHCPRWIWYRPYLAARKANLALGYEVHADRLRQGYLRTITSQQLRLLPAILDAQRTKLLSFFSLRLLLYFGTLLLYFRYIVTDERITTCTYSSTFELLS